MRKSSYVILCVLTLAAVVACKRMPLYDLAETSVLLELKLDLELDVKPDLDVHVDIDVDTVIPMPEHMKACFYATDNGGLRYTEFVGPTGGLISTPAGQYDMVVYQFGTEYIQIRGEGDRNTLEAFTSDITATKGATLSGFTRTDIEEPKGPIIYTPDHMLVAREPVVIPNMSSESQTVTIHAEASDIVETYAFKVKSVIGAKYIESCEAFVTNQARTSFFGIGKVSTEPATIWFPVGVDRNKGCLYTLFNTFGKLPGESRCYLHILVCDTDGQEHRFTVDITDDFDRDDHNIDIDIEINIPEPASHGGGIAPTVDEWDEQNTDVPIG